MLRRALFWAHLGVGLAAGLVIFVMAATGVILSLGPQIVDFVQRDRQAVAPPAPGQKRISVEEIVARAREARAGAMPSAVTIMSDPDASASVAFGRGGVEYVNPYTGAALGKDTWVHDFMHLMEDVHRWLGSREIGRPITGAASLLFLGLAVSGLFLWWPRKVVRFRAGLLGRPRDWNRHNVVGAWSSAALVVITATGVIMSYSWANALLYRAVGETPPPPQNPRAAEKVGAKKESPPVWSRPAASLDALWAVAEAQSPGWRSISLRFAGKAEGPVAASIEESGFAHPSPRSQLRLDPATAGILSWEPYSGISRGRFLRLWVKPIHTGQALGLVGQGIAALAAFGTMVLTWTGFALAWRRFRAWRARRDEERGVNSAGTINARLQSAPRRAAEPAATSR